MLRDNTLVKIVAIIALAAMDMVALHYGIDHVLSTTIGAIIGGIAGYEFKGLGGGRSGQ